MKPKTITVNGNKVIFHEVVKKRKHYYFYIYKDEFGYFAECLNQPNCAVRAKDLPEMYQFLDETIIALQKTQEPKAMKKKLAKKNAFNFWR